MIRVSMAVGHVPGCGQKLCKAHPDHHISSQAAPEQTTMKPSSAVRYWMDFETSVVEDNHNFFAFGNQCSRIHVNPEDLAITTWQENREFVRW